MSEMQTVKTKSPPPIQMDVEMVFEDLSSAASTIQSLIDHQDREANEALRLIPRVLKQAQEAVRQIEARRRQSEAELVKAEREIQNNNDLQALMDILPVGIIISHDPQNHQMTINRTAMQLLNLPPDSNP